MTPDWPDRKPPADWEHGSWREMMAAMECDPSIEGWDEGEIR